MSFPAAYTTECTGCGENIYPGDPITRANDGSYVHEECA